MRRLLAAVIASGAIAAIAGPLAGSASAAYIGTFWSYQNGVQLVTGPEPISDAAVTDANVACSWTNGVPPENAPWLNPCRYSGTQHGVCVNVMDTAGNWGSWECGWEVAALYWGGYGYTALWSWLPYTDVALFAFTNYG
jgi:hypothetical protein